jgi:hypothetical protein
MIYNYVHLDGGSSGDESERGDGGRGDKSERGDDGRGDESE